MGQECTVGLATSAVRRSGFRTPPHSLLFEFDIPIQYSEKLII
jgi:hypothetical protein